MHAKTQILLLTLLLASTSAIAQTITVNSRALFSGSFLEPATTFTGTQVTLGAATNIFSNGSNYTFLFWITPCEAPTTSNPTGPCSLPSGASTATAWYAKDCTSPCPGIFMTAFSISDNATLSGTPIANVTPANLWTPGSTTVALGPQPAIITAQSTLDNESFANWLQFGPAQIAGQTLTVPGNNSDFGIAFYKAPPADPCYSLEQAVVAEFKAYEQNPPKATLQEVEAAIQRVKRCEQCSAITDPTEREDCWNHTHPPKPLQ